MAGTGLPIYDPRRAIEMLRSVKPVRLFAILFPLWDVETTAVQVESRPYELMEKYVERGIVQGDLHTVEELARFFGLHQVMVQKILHLLSIIGHVTCVDERWEITELGQRSIAEGKRYVEQEKRTRLYFDGFSSAPLQKGHYHREAVHILSPREAIEAQQLRRGGYRFRIMTGPSLWRSAALQELEARVDRYDYNIPPEMYRIQVLSVQQAYLPMYIIEVDPGRLQGARYLVYTGIRGRRDAYLEGIVNRERAIAVALSSEERLEPYEVWSEWLDERGINGILPMEQADGIWQVVLPAAMFEGERAKFPLSKVGDYELRRGYFMQIWCDDPFLRCKA
ncbi:MAG: hypothetical protein J2P37_28545, partial [Ktedonobacteraceae bacterium]|nr:hypothetical protein [Ktedonobacteraceae bacterium]